MEASTNAEMIHQHGRLNLQYNDCDFFLRREDHATKKVNNNSILLVIPWAHISQICGVTRSDNCAQLNESRRCTIEGIRVLRNNKLTLYCTCRQFVPGLMTTSRSWGLVYSRTRIKTADPCQESETYSSDPRREVPALFSLYIYKPLNQLSQSSASISTDSSHTTTTPARPTDVPRALVNTIKEPSPAPHQHSQPTTPNHHGEPPRHRCRLGALQQL